MNHQNFQHLIRNLRTGETKLFPLEDVGPYRVGTRIHMAGADGVTDEWDVIRSPDYFKKF